MPLDDSVFFATLSELGARLRAKEFTSVQLTTAFLDRFEKSGARYNAVALTLRKAALDKAKLIDDDLKRGRDRGPLHGIPYGAKDLLAVKGSPTQWGATPYAGQIFDEDAAVIRRLDKAGAILLGKLAMVELAGGPSYRYASASATGPGLNPWDVTRWSGGSSSGSGSAVAAGMVTFAIGSETSGSILTPSAFCGITGLRPTYGLVSRAGAMALSWTLDKLGPMARSAEDCAHILQAIAGKDNDDPGSAGKSFYYTPQFVRKFSELTIGYNPDDFDGWADPDARPVFQQALAVFRSFGAKMVEVELPAFPYGPVLTTIMGGEAATIFEELIASGKVDKLADQKQIAGLKATQDILAKDYLRASRIRGQIQRAFRELFVNADVLLAPARNGVASPITEPLDRPSPRTGPPPKSRGLQGLIPAANLAGLPALCVPCGFASNLPVAVQLVGRPFTENTLVAFGKEYQSKTDWHRRKPPAL
jgi:aspartyl-tRNA(Asn)/glutamyl-tRNA(Gln) amidotransferase subunit A